MGNRALLATGAVGILAAVICCGAPGLVAGLAAISLAGTAAFSGWTLIAIVAVAVALAGYFACRRRAAWTLSNKRIAPDGR